MSALLTTDGLVALATLSAMEIVLGIDNVVFIAILVARLPEGQREFARRLGLILALGVQAVHSPPGAPASYASTLGLACVNC